MTSLQPSGREGPPGLPAATFGTYLAFVALGFAAASWASRIPQVKQHLHLSPAGLGLVLLVVAAGSVIALPLAGPLVTHFGSRRVLEAAAWLMLASLLTVSIGYLVGIVPVVVGLFGFGCSNGIWDVSMNVHAADVERRHGRAMLSRFHAGYSVGTVGGALIGVGVVAAAVPVAVHLFVVALLMGAGGLVAARSFIPETHEPEPAAATTAAAAVRGGAAERRARTRRAFSAWTESRTLLIGVFMLAFSFAEGAGYDWISLSTIDGYDQPATVGTIAFATFVAAMTGLRWVGPALLDRYGRVPVLRCLAALAGVGLLLFVYGPNLATALVGVILWGAGVSLGFPTGISAASDQPAHAAARVSVVASIGYCAFLTGPPVIGFLGDHLSVLRSLTVLVGLVALAFAVAGALRPLPHGEPSGAGLSGPPGGRR